MRMYKDLDSLRESVKGFLEVTPKGVSVSDEAKLKSEWTDTLVNTAVFGASAELKGTARFFLKGLANAAGIHLASIQGLYEAIGRGEAGGFTVPAMNIRGLSYDTARAFYRAANGLNCRAFLFEIAKSEMGYTSQPAHEYVAVMIGAALREGYRGPLCIQGDHFQASAKSYFEDPEREISILKSLITESLDAGFYNIDIDSSTLVVLEKPSLAEQQRDNAWVCGALTAFIRRHQPEGIEVTVGGEIGEVGGHNSTVEEFRAFIEAYRREIPADIKGISKISVQTGTSHGGVPLPDGSIAEVSLDFDVLSSISKVSREEYGLGGTVQHGASTLPDEAFNQFPKHGACEVHLATGFQNIVYDHPAMPAEFREQVYEHLRTAHASEHKEGQTGEQFLYKTRKKGFGGDLKREWWGLPESVREAVGKSLEEKFAFLIDQLGVKETREAMSRFVPTSSHPAVLKSEIQAAGGGLEIVDDGNPLAD